MSIPDRKSLTPQQSEALQQSLRAYWRRNLTIMGILLVIWAGLGLGCGILFADYLNQFHLPGTGFPLGFWFAQQGSIIGFVLVVLAYCVIMNRVDAAHHREFTEIMEGLSK